ncbi:MAG: (2Fe-2S)-binding protein [Cyclobacteriaceae bacterium]|nr:(2Fe-2S)-binding protein [Cyclobacteriaceae bacterium]
MEKSEGIPESPDKAGKGLSRRGFLKGAGLTTAGSVMLQHGLLGKDKEEVMADATQGPDPVRIQLKVNGKLRHVNVEPRDTLAKTLREHLKLTGTKVVCDRGSCSACTVWLDNTPVNSCMTLAFDAVGKEITTIEGLEKDGKLHPVQEAFIDHDASMCGFCTPGMVMSAAHLVNNHSNPTLEDVKHAVRGNLCRCGTHPNVFKATLAAAKAK